MRSLTHNINTESQDTTLEHKGGQIVSTSAVEVSHY